MKTTKTVDVTICDLCEREGTVSVCAKCKKDICQNCRESFSTHSWRSDGGESPSFDGMYCVACSPSIAAAIVELGFTLRPVRVPTPQTEESALA